MTPPIPRTIVVLAALAAVPLTGCTNQQEGFLIRRAVYWSTEEADGVTIGSDCVADPQATLTLNRGLLDLRYGVVYTVPLDIENRMLDTESSSSPNGISDGEIVLTEMEVELDAPQAPEIIDSAAAQDPALVNFAVPIQSISIEPGSQVGFLAEVIPPATGSAFADAFDANPNLANSRVQVDAIIHLRGKRAVAGGKRNEIEAREFRFPIDLCYGCLFICVPCAPETSCSPDAFVDGGVCNNAQDFPVFPYQCLND